MKNQGIKADQLTFSTLLKGWLMSTRQQVDWETPVLTLVRDSAIFGIGLPQESIQSIFCAIHNSHSGSESSSDLRQQILEVLTHMGRDPSMVSHGSSTFFRKKPMPYQNHQEPPR